MSLRFRTLWQHTLLILSVMLGTLALHSTDVSAVPPKVPWEKGGQSRAEDLKVTLLTFSPGPQVPSWFGHTAIGVEDTRLGRKRIYNYGMFSFDKKMLMRFVMGRLEFWVGAANYNRTLRLYARQDRDVRILELNLPPDKTKEMAEYLEWNIKPANKQYLYHHYDDNCATRIRDLIDKATNGEFKKMASKPARLGLRGHTRRHAQWPILDFGMMFAESHDVDKPIQVWDEMFLPGELEKNVKLLKYKDASGVERAVAGKETIYHKTSTLEPTPMEPKTLWPWLLVIGVLVGLGGFGLGRRFKKEPEAKARRVMLGLYHAMVGACFGGAGSILLFMWLFTDHELAHHNENLFYASPLLLFVVMPLGLAFAFGGRKARALLPKVWLFLGGLALLGLVVKVLLWSGHQQNWMTLALCLPMLLGMVASAKQIQHSESA